jgi:hypothetical protein
MLPAGVLSSPYDDDQFPRMHIIQVKARKCDNNLIENHILARVQADG